MSDNENKSMAEFHREKAQFHEDTAEMMEFMEDFTDGWLMEMGLEEDNLTPEQAKQLEDECDAAWTEHIKSD